MTQHADAGPPGAPAAPGPATPSRLERLGRYLAVDPANPALLRDYAQEASRSGETEACEMALRKLAGLNQAGPGDQALWVRTLRRLGRHAEALEAARAGRSHWPDVEPHAWALEEATCLFAAREFEAALEALPDVPPEHETAAAVCALRVRVLHHLGRLDEADEAARTFEAAAGVHPQVQASRITVLIDRDQGAAAAAIAQDLLARAPDAQQAPYEVAEALAIQALDQERSDQALQWTGWAHQRRRDDGRIWLLTGLAYLQAGAGQPAVEALEQAASLMPGHAGSHLTLGWACLLQGDRDAARVAFEAGTQASPAFAEAHGSLAVLEAVSGRAEAARVHLRKAQMLDRTCASALFAAAVLEGRATADVAQLARRVITRARARTGGGSGPAGSA